MSNELKSVLAQKAKEGLKPSPYKTIQDMLMRMSSQIQAALPKHMNVERITRIAMTEIRKNPKLLQASQTSLLGAIMTSAQLGLEPGVLGNAYLVPYYNTNLKSYEVQLIIGYKGLLNLVYRSGEVSSVYADVVYEKDTFEFEQGLTEKLRHIPKLTGDRGAIIAVYAIAHFKNGMHYYIVMSHDDIEKIRSRSKAPDNGPWATDYVAMAKKTAIKQLCKYLPMSVEVQKAILVDESTRREISTDMVEEVPDETDWEDTEVEIQMEPQKEEEKEEKQITQEPEKVKEIGTNYLKQLYKRLEEVYPNSEQRKRIFTALCKRFKVKSLALLTKEQAEEIMDELQ